MLKAIHRTIGIMGHGLFLLLVTAFIMPEPAGVDKATARVFADALYEEGQYIAVIYVPGLDSEPRALESGIVPLYEPDFLEVGLEHHLLLTDVEESIKGDFDSVVIMPDIMMATDHWNTPEGLEKEFFMPFPDSRWILALKRSIKDGKATTDWLKDVKDLSKYKSFLNENTAYELVEDPDGAICLKWPEAQEKPEGLVMADEKLVADLKALGSAIGKLPADRKSPEARSAMEKAAAAMQTEAGKAMATELLTKFPAIPPPKKDE